MDGVIPEPPGGAHRDLAAAAVQVGDVIENALEELEGMPAEELLEARLEKYRQMGRFLEERVPQGTGDS